MKSESCSNPCSKHGRGRVQLGRYRVGRVGTMAVHAQVQVTGTQVIGSLLVHKFDYR